MALQDQLIKINLDNLDTKGLYFKDTHSFFNKREINKNDLKKLDYENIDIVLKFYFRNKQIKKTLKFSKITGLQAVKNAAAKRVNLKNELEDIGIIKKKEFNSLNHRWEQYIADKKSLWSDGSYVSNTGFYDKWIKKELGNINFEKIKTLDFQNIVNHILNSINPKTKKPFAPRTAQSVQQQMRALYNYFLKQEIIEKNPAINIVIPKFDNTVNFDLSNEDRMELFNKILNYDIFKYRGIMLFLFMGRRLNEVLTLRWEEVIFNDELSKFIIIPENSKDRKRHEYPLSKPLEDFLMEYGLQKKGYVFEGEKTPHITDNTFRNHWKQLIKKTNFENMRIHDTRHVLGNNLINKGVSEDIIAKVLGHTSYSITSRYSKVHLNSINEALNIYLEDLGYGQHL